jgi:PAS domain S-box-containing protein
MNSTTTKDYEQLLKEFSELQLRVTRFSFTEQQLINTRDQLDHELVNYKRLSLFNSQALKSSSIDHFSMEIAEAIVDIFEVEASVVLIKNSQYPEKTILYIEGINNSTDTSSSELCCQITSFSHSFLENQSRLLNVNDLEKSEIFEPYQEGFLFYFHDHQTGYSAYLIGLISKDKFPLYKSFEVRHETIFKIFVNQVRSHLENRIKGDKIQEQIEQISTSELELKKLSLIATRTKNSVIISDAEGKIEWVNDAFQKITGYRLEEVKGRKPKDFLQGPGSDMYEVKRLSEALKKNENIETTLINYNKSGQPYYNQLEITPVFNEQNKLVNFISIQRDITEEMRIKQEILKINSRFELIAKKSNIGIWEWDPINKTVVWNDVLYDIYGATQPEVDSILLDFWKSSIHPDDRQRIVSESNHLVENLEKQLLEHEFRIIRRNDQAIRELKSVSLVERDKDGIMLRLIGTAIDVTEIKQYERAILAKNTELKKINSELDNFVYSVSHDLRSPLLSIKGILSLVFSSSQIDEMTENYLKLAEKSVIRLDETIQEILEYSRNARLEVTFENFDIAVIIETIFEDLKFSTSDNFKFDYSVSGKTMIHSDKSRIEILLKNLIGNAVKYQRKDIENPFVLVEFNQNKNEEIQFSISDNGEGIPEKHLANIFDMFYRASSSGQGTGLGLYICKEIATKLNATIEIQSQQNEGTTVQLSIPVKK